MHWNVKDQIEFGENIYDCGVSIADSLHGWRGEAEGQEDRDSNGEPNTPDKTGRASEHNAHRRRRMRLAPNSCGDTPQVHDTGAYRRN